MRLFLLGIFILLSGCSTLGPRSFNAVEYDYAVKTTVASTRAIHLCGDVYNSAKFKQFVNDLNENSMTLFEYERHLDGNNYSLPAATQIRQLVIDFTVNPQYTKDYCVSKLSTIQSASRTLARALGKLNAFDMCDSDVAVRFAKYEELYKQGKITQAEFQELANDIVKLKKVDSATCSFENKEKLDATIALISKVIAVLPL